MVVGFHHKKGSQVEYVYPPLPGQSGDGAITLPIFWKDLPSLALPDGAHKYENDVVFFHLPSTDEPKRTIFAVSCLQQVESSQFKAKDVAVTRSSVLKSICVLSAVPLFGLISSKVALATHVWFGQEDFSDVDLLKDLYKSLTIAVPSPVCPDLSVLCIDLDFRNTIARLGKKLIRLFKLLLLEPKMMFLIEPTADLSKIILGFLSLYPGMLEKGLLLSGVSPHVAPPLTPVTPKSLSTFEETVSKSSEKECESDELKNVQASIDLISRSLVIDDCGFPLAIFGPENSCLPYVSVSFLERLPLLKSYLIGCTNVLFLHKGEFDVIIQTEATSGQPQQQSTNVNSQNSTKKLKVEFRDRLLKKIVKPTPSDARFIGWILKTIEADAINGDPYFAGSNWVASDEWIREQFRVYLLGLLSSVAHNDEKLQESYGTNFIAAWRRSLNHSVWLRAINPSQFLKAVHPGDDPEAAGNFVASSSIFGSSTMATLSGASAIASATAAQLTSKAAVVSKAADGAKKFLFGRAGNLVSSVFSTPITPPPKDNQNKSSQQRPHASSDSVVASSSDLSIHHRRTTVLPTVDSIDDRGGEAAETVYVDRTKTVKSEEAESML